MINPPIIVQNMLSWVVWQLSTVLHHTSCYQHITMETIVESLQLVWSCLYSPFMTLGVKLLNTYKLVSLIQVGSFSILYKHHEAFIGEQIFRSFCSSSTFRFPTSQFRIYILHFLALFLCLVSSFRNWLRSSNSLSVFNVSPTSQRQKGVVRSTGSGIRRLK